MPLDQNNPPITTPITTMPNGEPNVMEPAWVRYFLALQAQITELQANSGGGGSSVLPDQYRVEDTPTVAANGRLDPLDYTTYNGITISMLVDRALSLTDPVFTGGAGAVNARKGKRLTLMTVFTSGGSLQMFGTNLQLQPIGDLTVNTGALMTQRASFEWRFDDAGFGNLVSVWQSV